MGPMNWPAVIAAALLATALRAVWEGRTPPLRIAVIFGLLLLSAAMLGHALARIGPVTLAAKPQLYFMQSGGLAAAFVIPALWISAAGKPVGAKLRDAAFWLLAYLAMGAVFYVAG